MALENLSEVLVPKSGRSGAHGVEKQVYPNRKIRSVEETNFTCFHHLPDSRQLAIPARGTDHNTLSGRATSFNVLQDRQRDGEIDDSVNRGELRRRQRGSLWIVRSAQDIHLMAAFARHFGHQRTSLTPP